MSNALIQTDSYKLSHKGFMNHGTTKIYSNLTARSSEHFKVSSFDGKVVMFGLQAFLYEYLLDEWKHSFFYKPKEIVIAKMKRLLDAYLGPDAVPMSHFEALHDLGYLPIRIKALPEGARVNIKVPLLTIENTHPDFAWLTNYLETVMSCELWKPITTATIIYEYRKMINNYAMKTTGSLDGTQFQIHGFEFRGMSGRHDAAINAAAMLLSTCGTDTVPALSLIEEYYHTDLTKDFIATSVPASEHSIACLGTSVSGELESYRKWITENYPNGIVSLVSDTYDYWRVLTEYLPALKDDILARPANALGLSKVVIRPDSGDPVKIICGDHEAVPGTPEYKGSIELMWEVFGGTVTEQGYKVLDSHIGLIYGDSITLERCGQILERLRLKGFASTNVVLGVGSCTMQYITPRHIRHAPSKATYAEVGGVGYELFKDPVTDSGTKKSAKGLLRVDKVGNDYVLKDCVSQEESEGGELQVVFENGRVCQPTSFASIRERLWGVR